MTFKLFFKYRKIDAPPIETHKSLNYAEIMDLQYLSNTPDPSQVKFYLYSSSWQNSCDMADVNEVRAIFSLGKKGVKYTTSLNLIIFTLSCFCSENNVRGFVFCCLKKKRLNWKSS